VDEMTTVDLEREKAYKMGEEINAQLDHMGLTLSDLVKRLNETQENSMDKNNPVFSLFCLYPLPSSNFIFLSFFFLF
jgi:hypothetical protein